MALKLLHLVYRLKTRLERASLRGCCLELVGVHNTGGMKGLPAWPHLSRGCTCHQGYRFGLCFFHSIKKPD